RKLDSETLTVSLDEVTSGHDVTEILEVFAAAVGAKFPAGLAGVKPTSAFSPNLTRTSSYLTHPVFHSHHSETEMLRYMHKLQAKDLSLTHSMIPLGSCTMKLNATAEMFPVTWAEFGQIHPFAPLRQTHGYQIL